MKPGELLSRKFKTVEKPLWRLTSLEWLFFVVNVYTIVYTYKYREDIVFKRSVSHGNRITEMG